MLHANSLTDSQANIYFWILLLIGFSCYLIVRKYKAKLYNDKSDAAVILYLCCIAFLTGGLGLLFSYGILPTF